VVEELAAVVRRATTADGCRVAVDGVDGAGKTVLADELAAALTTRGVPVVRVSVDGFHRPREVRYRRGRDDSEGFFRDSYDHDAFVSLVLEPFAPGGSRMYVPAVRDVADDRALERVELAAPREAVLLVDGIFLHRDELAGYWDVSVWVDVPFEVAYARMAARDGSSPDPTAPGNRRYVEGQRLYLRECDPASRATVVVDNADLAAPAIRAVRPARRFV
jgi:uridine kinase